MKTGKSLGALYGHDTYQTTTTTKKDNFPFTWMTLYNFVQRQKSKVMTFGIQTDTIVFGNVGEILIFFKHLFAHAASDLIPTLVAFPNR